MREKVPSLVDLASRWHSLCKRMMLDFASLYEEVGGVDEAAAADMSIEQMYGDSMEHIPVEQQLVYWRRKGRYAVKMNDRTEALEYYGEAMDICINQINCDCHDAVQLTIFEELKKLLLEEREQGGGGFNMEYLQEVESRDEALRNRWNQKWDDALEELRQETKEKRPSHKRSGRKKKRQQGRGVGSSVAIKGFSRGHINEDEPRIGGKSECIIETCPTEDLELLECAICLMGIGEDEEQEENNHGEATNGNMLNCCHKFHSWCLTDWFAMCEKKGYILSCPECRSEPLTDAMGSCGRG